MHGSELFWAEMASNKEDFSLQTSWLQHEGIAYKKGQNCPRLTLSNISRNSTNVVNSKLSSTYSFSVWPNKNGQSRASISKIWSKPGWLLKQRRIWSGALLHNSFSYYYLNSIQIWCTNLMNAGTRQPGQIAWSHRLFKSVN